MFGPPPPEFGPLFPPGPAFPPGAVKKFVNVVALPAFPGLGPLEPPVPFSPKEYG